LKKTFKKVSATTKSKTTTNFPIVVIGASAGGYNAIVTLLKNLSSEINIAILIVTHSSESSNTPFLIQNLQRFTKFKCMLATGNMKIQARNIYYAVGGLHMMISRNGRIDLGTGPEENRFKPSIDILFRTAAVVFRERVIGVILSGLLDDGVAGMLAIQRCGGTCIVQDPVEAEYPNMPMNVMEKLKPDYVLSVTDIGNTILKESRKKRKKRINIPVELAEEVAVAQNVLSGINQTKKLGVQSYITCPECGGTLWHVNDPDMERYRCFTGHAFSEKTLLESQRK
jgi:two-component system, chemotaxis family, protein-glutamate methylesterase/glutaminase